MLYFQWRKLDFTNVDKGLDRIFQHFVDTRHVEYICLIVRHSNWNVAFIPLIHFTIRMGEFTYNYSYTRNRSRKHENFEDGLHNKNNNLQLHNMKFSSSEASEVGSHEFFSKDKISKACFLKCI